MRHPTELEIKLLEELICRVHVVFTPDWKNRLLVSDLSDGGMGSLALHLYGVDDYKEHHWGSQASDCLFDDIDGITVVASLYLDEKGELYELDIWKTNWNPLIDIPITYRDV